jgi:transposase
MPACAGVRVAREQIARLRALSREVDALGQELLVLVEAHRPQLLAETGCGALTAAVLIGRTAGAERFPSDASFARLAGTAPIPCSSGQRDRHRLDRGATASSTAPCIPSPSPAPASTRPPAPTWRAKKPRARAGRERSAASSHLGRRFHHLLSMPAQSPQHDPRGAAETAARPQQQTPTITGAAPAPMPCLT